MSGRVNDCRHRLPCVHLRDREMAEKRKNHAKVQHYVPQLLLRNFRAGKKDTIWAFDKWTGKTFRTNVRNVAAESRFYDFSVEEHTFTFEPALSRIENAAKAVIEKILRSDSLTDVALDDRAVLSVFLTVQYVRTKAFREGFRHLHSEIRKWLHDVIGDSAKIDESGPMAAYLRQPDDNELAMVNVEFIRRAPLDLAIHFANKAWLLIATTPKYPFVIGDHPVAMDNSIDRENIGLALPGVEIYFPLSATRALAMWSQAHVEMLTELIATDVRILPLEHRLSMSAGISYAKKLVEAIESGLPLRYDHENVQHFNSLQVIRAERYVFSSINDFSLAQKMIERNPDLKYGPRVEVVN